MEHLAGCGVAGELGEVLVLAFAVGGIANDWKADVFEVDPDLMGAAGVETCFHQGDGAEAFEEPKAGPGVASAAIGYGHAFAVGRMPGNGGADFALFRFEATAEQGVVDLVNGA